MRLKVDSLPVVLLFKSWGNGLECDKMGDYAELIWISSFLTSSAESVA